MAASEPSVPLVETVHLRMWFPLPRSLREQLRHRPRRSIHAVDDVSLTIRRGETLALIGESGSGKTTFGWVVARLHDPTGGTLRFDGEDVTRLSGESLRLWRRRVQIVFQDPVGSLDPRLKVWQIVGEPLRAQFGERPPLVGPAGRRFVRRVVRSRSVLRPLGELWRAAVAYMRERPPAPPGAHAATVREAVRRLLPEVGLPADCLDQYPHEFSGGGRQRLSLARALIVNPSLVVLDEPTSALDVSVQAQVLNRLVELQRERGLTYLLITHNVAVVRYIADRVAVLYLGQLIELGPAAEVLAHPIHPYTKALLAAVPVPDVKRRHTRYRIRGDVPSLIDPAPGCRFAPRCPFVEARCRASDPPLEAVRGSDERRVACWRAAEIGSVAPSELLEMVREPARASAP